MNGQSFTIGIVIPDIVNTFFAEIAHGAVDTAWEYGYKSLLCETEGDPQRENAVLQLLRESQTDGVILCETCLSDDTLREWIGRHHAVVLLNHPLPDAAVGSIRINSLDGMHQVIHHLVTSGRKNLCFLVVDSPSYNHQEQISGFFQASQHYMAVANTEVISTSTWEGGYTATRNLLKTHPEIDGLVCHSDLVATGALYACVGLGKRVPGDIAIIGCDDGVLARVAKPALTTLHVPKYEVGAMAVRLLLERIEGEQMQDEVVVTQKLVVRASAP